MAGVLILLTISVVINVLLAKVLVLKHEETLRYRTLYKSEMKRCARLESEKFGFHRKELKMEDLLR